MPWCLNCNEEYIKGTKTCPECKGTLSEDCPKKEYKSYKEANLKLLLEANDDVGLMFLTNSLDSEGINYEIIEKGSGGYMRIYMGINVTGKKIYVEESDYDKAKAILDELNKIKAEETKKANSTSDDTCNLPSFSKRKNTVTRIIRIYLAISILVLLAELTIIFIFSKYL